MNELSRTGRLVRVLLVEDDPNIRRPLQKELSSRGFVVATADSVPAAREVLAHEELEVILLDLGLPDGDGLTLFDDVRAHSNPPEVIILTGRPSQETAVQALRLGAYDYLTKPQEPDDLERRIRHAAQRYQLSREVTRLRFLLADRDPVVSPVGKGPAFQRTLTLAQMVAPTDTSILLLGETGSGKDVLARYIHDISPRQKGTFVAINCAAIAPNLMEAELFGHEQGAFTGASKRRPGYFEMADGGTLFLDEIGELDMAFQSKFLRVVETGSIQRVGSSKSFNVNVRIISATNRELLREVNEGRFRADLYYRLQGFDIRIPPLRERTEDIPYLVEHFLAGRRGAQAQVTPAALELLVRAPWRGNVRELFHVLEKALIMAQGEPVSPRHLPLELAGAAPSFSSSPLIPPPPAVDLPARQAPAQEVLLPLELAEKQHILKVLAAVNNHQGRAAEVLQISPRTLYRKLKEYEQDLTSAEPGDKR